MIEIVYVNYTDDGLEYIGIVDESITPEIIKTLMETICERQNVSIYWDMNTETREIFVSIDLCPAKICTGHFR